MARERDLPRHPTENAATPLMPLRHSQQPVVKDSRGELWKALENGEFTSKDFDRNGQLRMSATVGVLRPIENSADWRVVSERIRSGTRYGMQVEVFGPPDPPTPKADQCDPALRVLHSLRLR